MGSPVSTESRSAGLLSDARRQLGHDPSAAGNLLRECIDGATPDDRDVVAHATYLLARVSLFEGEADTALALIAQARAQWTDLGRPIEACRTDLGRINVLGDLGRHSEAATTAERLLRDLDDVPAADDGEEFRAELRWLRAAASENLGGAVGSMGHHQRAITAYAAAEVEYEAMGSGEDLGRVKANHGIELIEMGLAADGVRQLGRALKLFEAADDELAVAKCLMHIGEGETALGRHSAALTALERASTVFVTCGAPVESARAALSISSLYLELNLIEEAHGLASTAFEVFDRHALIHDVARAAWHVAMSEIRLGHPAAAVEPAELAVDSYNEAGDATMAARALLTLSEAHHALGRTKAALRHAQAGAATIRLTERPGLLVVALLWLSIIQPEDHERSEALLDEARRIVDELRLPELEFLVAHRTGCLRLAQGKREAARSELERAVQIAESLKGALAHRSLRTGFLLRRAEAHADLIRVLLASGRPDDELTAFRYVEESKRVTSNHRLPTESDTTVSGDPGAARDIAPLAQLHAAYDVLIRRNASESSEDHGLLRARIDQLEREVSVERFREGFHESGASTLRPAATEQAPRAINGHIDHAVVHHLLGDEVLAFVWTAGVLTVERELCRVDEVRELLEAFRIHCGRERLAMTADLGGNETVVAGARHTLQSLHSLLFAPIAHRLRLDQSELFLAPDPGLAAVPYAALHDGSRALDDVWHLRIVPSLSNPVPEVTSTTPVPSKTRTHATALVMAPTDPSIPGADEEAREVAARFGVDPYLGDEATWTTFARRAPGTAIVHLAAHGMHRTARPGFSGLRFADRWVSSSDLETIDLRGVLAVLSACESGLHLSRGLGDEPTGLARTFIASGASAVLVTLWPVDDRSTTEFMAAFSERIVAGDAPRTALRAARRRIAERFPHPFHWAPFVLLEGTTPLPSPASPQPLACRSKETA